MRESKLILRYLCKAFSVFVICFSMSFSAVGDVVYENPIENEFGHALFDASLESLLSKAEVTPVDSSALEAQYLLGEVYRGGNERLGVERDVEKGLMYLRRAWSNGAADAGLSLAYINYNGDLVDEDFDASLAYLTKSAEMGFLRAQRELGKAYLGGEGWDGLVEEDIAVALSWLEKSANAGDLESANILADVYYSGNKVEKNLETAFYWLLASSESKYGWSTVAFRLLGELYEEGIGTEVDLVQSYKYYDLVDPSGAADKARLAEQMTDEQIAEAIRQSRAWQEEHNTFVPSYYNLEYQEDGSFR